MRILFTSFPGLGHLHPLMPLARAAGAAGHDVRLASGPDLVDWANRAGVYSYPVGCTQTAAAAAAHLDFAGPQRTAHMFTDVWVSRALPDLLDLAVSCDLLSSSLRHDRQAGRPAGRRAGGPIVSVVPASTETITTP